MASEIVEAEVDAEAEAEKYILTFNVTRVEFVQMLHSGGCNWVVVSTIACPPSTVEVYDSLYSAPTQAQPQHR